jgi:hypothetical protein
MTAADADAESKSRHARPAWRPICAEGSGAAQLGGLALLGADEEWPSCRGCQAPMRLFLQIDLAALPPAFAARGSGILQLFYCSTDDGRCETWAPFSGTHLVRLLGGEMGRASHPPSVTPFPARHVSFWEEIVDYPSAEEPDDAGAGAHDDHLPAFGDKLGGWPAWVQGAEYPSCPTCGTRMELVFQIDSENNIPHMFGDMGCGHITQCPEHPEVLAFGWACG